MPKFVSLQEAVDQIKDGATVFTTGFGLAGMPESMAIAISESFEKTGHPRDLTVYCAAGAGDFKGRGVGYLAKEGLLKRYVGGHFGAAGPGFQAMIADNKVEAYNLPQGVIATMPRNIAAKRPALFTKVGLGTFVDPRLEGGKANEAAKDDLVEVFNFKGEEWMCYYLPKVDVAIIRGNVSDENGNITIEKDGVMVETFSVAEAAKSCGGIVIAEVELVAKAGSLHPKRVKVPGIVVDYVVHSTPGHHFQTMGTYYSPVFNGDIKVPTDAVPVMELSDRKIICRRAAMELKKNAVVNLGVGIPDGIAAVAAEEKVNQLLCMSTEGGGIGGIPAAGADFGNTINAEAIIEQPYQFDFYDGGGIDITYLGLAQVDEAGNLNVSKFNNRPTGCGGFINITQNAKSVVFCGTFTAGGLATEVKDGKLHILKEGKNKKFIKNVEQVTFSAKYSQSIHQPVLYVTERAVFELTQEGLELTEVADGVDLEKDILAQMEFKPIIKNVKKMSPEIFQESWGKLAGQIKD
ncbi:acyl CoA:acetate/3-ketoacid CoA transferase [Papillibacter cinnamivorans]|uniref:Propionate CoA-transferase n=1 Tax=Papillibacter cinnamivorans DSM 12816 TaxID=1122930 RepID=A0A1W2CLB4_9FIRM|nr:CoA-transferase [Papillibacter cinnamivorans]SMC85774.1 propionate CoA-transferase [Papillibacter cinnamivorans DSM 12816]